MFLQKHFKKVPAVFRAMRQSRRAISSMVGYPLKPGVHNYGNILAGSAVLGSAGWYWRDQFKTQDVPSNKLSMPKDVDIEYDVPMTNWSHTRGDEVKEVFQPETEKQVEELVAWAHSNGHKLRPVGSNLSPNGVALEKEGMISVTSLDKVLEVDKKNMTIRVQSGARIESILDTLKENGMTLENFSSITEQQIGGWTQVAAHGTGVTLPTVDEMVTAITIVTPGKGTLRLSENSTGKDLELFKMARVGMGTLGVVTEVTLKCIPTFQLKETVSVSTIPELRKNKDELLKKHRHLRFWFLPYTDTVAVYTIDKVDKDHKLTNPQPPADVALKPMTDLLRKLNPDCGDLTGLPMPEIRDRIMAVDPLNHKHMAACNRAEAEFWKLNVGERMGNSTDILGLNCGGCQWTIENCFSTGTLEKGCTDDLDYSEKILKMIETEKLPSGPMEQRWSASSTSPMSLAYSKNRKEIFSWVGIIQFIPVEELRDPIEKSFQHFAKRMIDIGYDYGALIHWGKVDLAFHDNQQRLEEVRKHLAARCDIDKYQETRKILDPDNILSNKLMNALFPHPNEKKDASLRAD